MIMSPGHPSNDTKDIMPTPASPQTVSTLAREYRTAVRNTVFWETHGTHGDGKLDAARKTEAAALRALTKAAK